MRNIRGQFTISQNVSQHNILTIQVLKKNNNPKHANQCKEVWKLSKQSEIVERFFKANVFELPP